MHGNVIDLYHVNFPFNIRSQEGTSQTESGVIDEYVNVDNWINSADTETYFDLLSEGYNNADFMIGTNLDYFMIEVQVSESE